MTIKECKSYNEMGQVLGYGYYNGRVKKAIIEFCVLNNLDPDEIIRENSKKPNKCLYCGKELEGKGKYTKKFCDSSCAASFNNKGRVHSEETKIKIKKALLNKIKLSDGSNVVPNLSTLIENGFILNPLNVKYDEIYVPPFKYELKTCVVCGKEFRPSLTSSGLVSHAKTCSKECNHQLKSFKSKEVMNKLISEGRHIGWQSRNIISYPEQFWMKVLENNNIDYKHNFFIKDRHYFLDFLININDKKIDLEIDGKQHKYEDRVDHDIERDKNLKEDGYLIYRVEWNSINTEEGSEKMKNKINDFINCVDDSELEQTEKDQLKNYLNVGKKKSSRQRCKELIKKYAQPKYGKYKSEKIFSDAYGIRSTFSHGDEINAFAEEASRYIKFVVLDVIKGYIQEKEKLECQNNQQQ